MRAILLSSLLLSVGTAHAETIERVVAVVDNDAILLSEVRRRATPMLAGGQLDLASPTEINALYIELVEELVEERLIEAEAARNDLSISDAALERILLEQATHNGLSLATLRDTVGQQGMSFVFYRERVRHQLLRMRVIERFALDRTTITEEQIEARYAELTRAIPAGSARPLSELRARLYREMVEEAMQEAEPILLQRLRNAAVVDVHIR